MRATHRHSCKKCLAVPCLFHAANPGTERDVHARTVVSHMPQLLGGAGAKALAMEALQVYSDLDAGHASRLSQRIGCPRHNVAIQEGWRSTEGSVSSVNRFQLAAAVCCPSARRSSAGVRDRARRTLVAVRASIKHFEILNFLDLPLLVVRASPQPKYACRTLRQSLRCHTKCKHSKRSCPHCLGNPTA